MLNYSQLSAAIAEKRILFGIYPLSDAGLRLAVEKAEAGFKVVCFDYRQLRLDMLRRGVSFLQEISSPRLKALVDSGMITPSGDLSGISSADFLALALSSPDSGELDSITGAVADHIRPGHIVVLAGGLPAESVRTSLDSYLAPRGLRPDRDYYFAS